MTGHFLLMAAIFVAPHLKEETGKYASLFCLLIAVLAMVIEAAVFVGKTTGHIK